MADPTPPPGANSILTFALITAITLLAEYLRRLMPPPRRHRRKSNDHDYDDYDDDNRDRESDTLDEEDR